MDVFVTAILWGAGVTTGVIIAILGVGWGLAFAGFFARVVRAVFYLIR